jgi:hypothetical protein
LFVLTSVTNFIMELVTILSIKYLQEYDSIVLFEYKCVTCNRSYSS